MYIKKFRKQYKKFKNSIRNIITKNIFPKNFKKTNWSNYLLRIYILKIRQKNLPNGIIIKIKIKIKERERGWRQSQGEKKEKILSP